MYVPMLKIRQAECLAVKKVIDCFGGEIMPLFEVVTNRFRGKETPLEHINTIMENRTFFLDYLRFDIDEYKNDVISEECLSYRAGILDTSKYISKLLELRDFDNIIPVLSIKEGFVLEENDLTSVILRFKSIKRRVAVRITPIAYLRGNYDFTVLDENDFLMLDIRESEINSQMMSYRELSKSKLAAQKILLNSPRKRSYQNPVYETDDYTQYIDNSVAGEYSTVYRPGLFNGFGDYAGLRDKLPEKRGGAAKGYALALLYMGDSNQFYSIRGTNYEEGVRGYKEIKEKILNKESFFDPKGDCPALKEIRRLTYGSWSSWHSITVMRYISQIYSMVESGKMNQLSI